MFAGGSIGVFTDYSIRDILVPTIKKIIGDTDMMTEAGTDAAQDEIQFILCEACKEIAFVKVKFHLTDEEVVRILASTMSVTFFFDKTHKAFSKD